MVIVGILSWWYGRGFSIRLGQARQQLVGIYDYFSIDLLIKTLFSPFRQISAGKVQGPLAIQFRAFVDRLFSRVIGFVVRSIMIAVGSIGIVGSILISLFMIAIWLVMPILPFVGIILALSGWVPWKI